MRDFYQAFAEARKLNKKRGFTLIELLVVIAIIAILAAIAIPQFAKYRVRAYNGAAESDLRNIRTTFEAVYADYQNYGTAVSPDNTNGSLTITTSGNTSEVINLSAGVYVDADLGDNSQSYTAATGHKSGDRIFCADSDESKLYYKVDTSLPIETNDVSAPTSKYGANDCNTGGYTNAL